MRQRLTDGTEHTPSLPEVRSKDEKTVLGDRERTPILANVSTAGEAITNTCPGDGTAAAARHDFSYPS